MIIIPAIDIMDGKCVRLTKGDYDQQTVYSENPTDIAKRFEDAGFSRLHLVDLDGAKAGMVKNWKVLEDIAAQTKLKIDFSGGIRSKEEVQRSFDSGAFYISIGSMAVTNEELVTEWINAYGAERFIIGADIKNDKIAINGWTATTDQTAIELIGTYKAKGVNEFFCTDVSKDGLLEGPTTLLYKKILTEHPTINLIASGGVADLKDLDALKKTGCSGAIVGKAIYENKISLEELKQFMEC